MMKVSLYLALVCCFVAVVKAGGCGCTLGMMECACKPANKNIIKAKVVNGRIYYGKPLGNGYVYKIIQRNFYKGADMDFKRVYVSRLCGPPLREGGIYILMGQYKGKEHEGEKIMELHRENNWVRYFENMEEQKMKNLRDLKEGRYVC